MRISVFSGAVVTAALAVSMLSIDVHAQECCETAKPGETLAASCSLTDTAASSEACCLPGTVSDTAATPWNPVTLGNSIDPISDDPSHPKIYLDYSDADGGVFGRIYFANQESRDSAKDEDLKALYEKAYLTRDDGTFASYGTTRLKLGNKFCPVSGVGNFAGRKLTLNDMMATNCTAGGCSLGDGFKANYNAVEIGACCPSCIKMLVEKPELFLSNLKPEIEAVLAEHRRDQQGETD